MNLLTNLDQIGESKTITTNQITYMNEYIRSFADTTSTNFVEDSYWSHLHLINSLDAHLLETEMSTPQHDFAPPQRDGMLTLALIIDQVINL